MDATVVGWRATATIQNKKAGLGDARPGCRDVENRLEVVGELAVASKGREGVVEGLKISLELRAVTRFERIEPAAAGEEPVARVAEK